MHIHLYGCLNKKNTKRYYNNERIVMKVKYEKSKIRIAGLSFPRYSDPIEKEELRISTTGASVVLLLLLISFALGGAIALIGIAYIINCLRQLSKPYSKLGHIKIVRCYHTAIIFLIFSIVCTVSFNITYFMLTNYTG
ncbi:hypothetical protein D3C80_1020540 [compost metagenome]